MNFWKYLQYGLMVVYAIIIGLGAYLYLDGDSSSTSTPQPISQPGQSKFNF